MLQVFWIFREIGEHNRVTVIGVGEIGVRKGKGVNFGALPTLSPRGVWVGNALLTGFG